MTQPSALVVIDYEDHSRGGHYGSYLRWFVREFSSRFDTVLVFTPEPYNTRLLLGLVMPGAAANVTCHALPIGPRKRIFSRQRRPCLPSVVFEQAADLVHGHRIHGFVMWGFDLLRNRAIARTRFGTPWATLGNLSHFKRGRASRTVERERRLEALCVQDPDCRTLLTWDQYVIPPNSEKIRWLPGQESGEVSAASPFAAAIRQHAGNHFCIGAFGTLSGPRCLNEILSLAKVHPEIRFVLAGMVDPKRVHKGLLPMLGNQKPDNILLIPGFQPEIELNSGIAAVDAVFIDGVGYPIHSGIVTKALLLGRCVVTPASNSWTHDMIVEYAVGVIYADRTLDISAAWAKWHSVGGSMQAERTIRTLISDAHIAQCFDQLTDVLKESKDNGAS